MGQTDVLGLSAIVDIDDIRKSITDVVGDLQRVGAVTKETSAKLQRELDKIGSSADKDLSARLTAAMNVLRQAMKETDAAVSGTPEKFAKAKKEVEALNKSYATLGKELASLKNERDSTVIGSKQFDKLNKAIESVEGQLQTNRQSLQLHTQQIQDLEAAQTAAANAATQLKGIYDGFVSSLHEAGDAGQAVIDAVEQQATATEQATEATQAHTQATQAAAAANAELVAGLEAIAAKAQDMGGKVGGSAKQLGDSVSKNVNFVKSHLDYIEKTKQRLTKAISDGDTETEAWAKNEIQRAEQRVQEAVTSIKTFMETIRQLSETPLPETSNSGTSSSPRQQLMEWRNEIVRLTLAYREMSNEERASAEGQELKAKLDELQGKAATLRDAMDDVNEAIKHDANDTAAFAGVTEGLNLLISGFGAAQGAAAAFGMSEQDLARAQTVIQGSLAATNFLTQAQTALQSQSALMRGINTLQTWAAAKATDVETAAKGRNIVATKAATVAQGIFNAIAKANPYVLLATAIVTVVGALTAFAIGTRKAKQEEEELQRVQEREKQFYDTYHNKLATTIDKYRELQHAYTQLKSAKEKTQWIKDNTDKFHDLGFELKGIEETERVFAGNTDAIIKAFDLRARAAAYAAKITATYNDALNGQTYKVGDKLSESKFKELFPAYANFKNHIGDTQYANMVGGFFSDDFYLSQKGVDELNKRALDQAEKDVQGLREQRDKLNEEAQRIVESLGVSTYKPNSGTTTTGTPAPSKQTQQYKSAVELNDELLALTKERIERELEIEREGTKRWEQLQRERIEAQAEIDRRAARKAGNEAIFNLEASYKGGSSGLDESGYQQRRAQLERQTQTIIAAIDAKALADTNALNKQRVLQEQANEDALIQQYQSYTDKRLQLEKQYKEDLAKIDAAITEASARGDNERVDALKRSRLQATQQHNEQQVSLSLQQLKETPDYVRAFEDLGNTSAQTLEYLIAEFEKAKQVAGQTLDPEKLREYTSTLQQMYDELNERNPYTALSQAAQDMAEAENKVRIATLAVAAATKKVEAAKAAKDAEKEAKANLELEEAQRKARQATDAVEQANNRYRKSLKAVLSQVNELAAAIAGLGDAIGGEAGQILGIISSVMTFTTQTIDGIKAVTATGVAALSTLEKASVILTIISAAIQLFQQISSMYKDAHGQYEEMAAKQKEINALRDAVNEYELAVLKATQAEKRWFANTGLGGLRDMYEYSNKAFEAYVEKLAQPQAIYQNESGGGWLTNALTWLGNLVSDVVSIPGKLITGALDKMGVLDKDSLLGKIADWGLTGLFGGAEGLIGKGVGALLDTLNYDEGYTSARNNLRIETREKSSGFLGTGIGGHSQRTENLEEWVRNNLGKELFDGMWVNKELANTILDKYGDKLVGETKATLEELVRLKEEYDKFREQLENYVSEMFSPLTDDMTDALWEWLAGGKDVMDSFKKYASDTFADIAKEMMKQALLQKVFDGFQDKLANLYEAYSTGADAFNEKWLTDEVMKATDTLLSNAEKQLPTLQNLLTYIDEQFKARGFDITGSEAYEQQGSSGAWQQLGEDTGQELNGRFTALQITGESILVQSIAQTTALQGLMQEVSLNRAGILQIGMNVDEIRETGVEMLFHLKNIDVSTKVLPEMAKTLESMDRKLDQL